MKTWMLVAMMLIATPAMAWRTGIGFKGGIIKDEPAVILHLELDNPDSHFHIQPRFQIWQPEDRSGIWELGIDSYWHSAPCEAVSLYLGGGLGVEWITEESSSAPCRCGTPPSLVDPPQPTAVAVAGVRFPTEYLDYFIEGRHTFVQGNNEQSGGFLGLTFHAPREVHRGHQRHR